MSIANQLREYIASSGTSRYHLSRLSGVPQGSLSRFVNGLSELSLEMVDKLAVVLNLNLQQSSKPKIVNLPRGRPRRQ